jgi:hypothetical protein
LPEDKGIVDKKVRISNPRASGREVKISLHGNQLVVLGGRTEILTAAEAYKPADTGREHHAESVADRKRDLLGRTVRRSRRTSAQSLLSPVLAQRLSGREVGLAALVDYHSVTSMRGLRGHISERYILCDLMGIALEWIPVTGATG